MKKLTISVICFYLCISCATILADETPTRTNWEYKIEITNPGTRSEGKLGYLFYRGKEIKGYFEYIIIENTRYSYQVPVVPWDFNGYRKDEDYIHRERFSNSALSRQDIGKGCYLEGFEQKKRGTPASWVWIKRDNVEAFVNPENLDAFIEAFGLRPLLPGGAMMTQTESVVVPKENNWEYEIEITNPGTRSEGKFGYLFYRGKEIKGYFEYIIIENTRYSYHAPVVPWDFNGYRKDEDYIHRERFSNSALSRQDIGKGCYLEGFEQKKRGTPASWVWIKRDNVEAFVNPENLDAFIEAFGLRPLVPGGTVTPKGNN